MSSSKLNAKLKLGERKEFRNFLHLDSELVTANQRREEIVPTLEFRTFVPEYLCIFVMDFFEQPSPGKRPQLVDRTGRNSHHFGRLIPGKACKKTQFDDFRST